MPTHLTKLWEGLKTKLSPSPEAEYGKADPEELQKLLWTEVEVHLQ